MADRFPSLDEFDQGQTTASGAPALGSTEEPSDFLARERAALGDDAEQFTTSADSAARTATVDDDDLLGGTTTNGNDLGDFQSSFPSIETGNNAVGPGGSVTGLTSIPTQAPSYQYEEEPQVIKEWRERRDLAIQHRDEVSASKKAATIKAAQEAIDEFYENYNNKKEKGISQTQKDAEEFLKSREDTTSGGTSWERIAKLVDLSGKGVGGGANGTPKAKMREMLLNLRKDENAPGASGV